MHAATCKQPTQEDIWLGKHTWPLTTTSRVGNTLNNLDTLFGPLHKHNNALPWDGTRGTNWQETPGLQPQPKSAATSYTDAAQAPSQHHSVPSQSQAPFQSHHGRHRRIFKHSQYEQ